MGVEHESGVRRHVFAAMGTSVALIAPRHGVTEARFRSSARAVEREFEEQEARFSRFRPDSELSRVNASAGHPFRVSHAFAVLLRLALSAAEESDGRFDPTVLRAMVAAGYDRDFDEVIAAARDVLRPAAPTGRWREASIVDGVLTLPPGVGLDLGGIAKGWTADRAAERVAPLLPWAVVDAGGDLRTVGDLPEDGVVVGVEHPDDPALEVLRLSLRDGALATSSVTRRSWGPRSHHLIDPATGRPALTEVVQATVWADRCADAEVGTKDAMLRGVEVLDELPAVLVMRDGTVVTNLRHVPSAA